MLSPYPLQESDDFSYHFTSDRGIIYFKLDQMGINEKELNKILGGCNRKSEILSGRRKLSLSMIRELHSKLKIPAETLIAEY